MPLGKHIYIKSRVSGLVVGVDPEANVDGSPVIMCPKVEGCLSQMWYECQISGTFRNRQSDLCMEIDVAEGEVGEGSVVVRKNKDADKSQEWVLAKDKIQNKHDHTLVLQNISIDEEEGSQVTTGEFVGSPSQLWDIDYVEANYFHIASKFNGKVVQIKGKKQKIGAKLELWTQSDQLEDHQLWYEDKYGIIKSKLNNFTLECAAAEIGKQFVTSPFSAGDTKQLWTRYEGKIISRVQLRHVICVNKKNKDNGAKLVVAKDSGEQHQIWDFHYI